MNLKKKLINKLINKKNLKEININELKPNLGLCCCGNGGNQPPEPCSKVR